MTEVSDDTDDHDVLKYYVPRPVPLWLRVAEWVVTMLIALIVAAFMLAF